MSHDRASRWHWILLLLFVGLVSTFAPNVGAQEAQGSIFNSALFNVGGVGVRPPDGSDLTLTQGSIGCGSAWGDGLSAILNAALNESIDDLSVPLDQRRDLWQFCDYMTNEGAGWDTAVFISPADEARQNTSYAPADLFGLADVAQSVANWQMGSIASRVQQLRTAARAKDKGAARALARRLKQKSQDRGATSLRSTLASPVSLANGGRNRDARDVRPADLARFLQEGLNAGDEALGIDGVGLFMSGRYVRLDADSTKRERGSQTDGGGLTLGADYRLTPDLVMGAAFGYNHYETDFARNGGNSQLDDFAVMLFSSLYLGDAFYFDGTVRGSYLMTDSTRKIANLGAGPAFADQQSDPDGWTVSADLGAGTEIAINGFLLNPYLRAGVHHTEIGGFSESGGDGSMSLVFDDQKATSLSVTLGGTVVYSLSTSIGVVAPYVRLEYVQEFLDQAADTQGFLRVIPQAQFQIRPNPTDRDYGNVGLGASITLRDGWAAYADYDALVGFSALDSHTMTLGLRKAL